MLKKKSGRVVFYYILTLCLIKRMCHLNIKKNNKTKKFTIALIDDTLLAFGYQFPKYNSVPSRQLCSLLPGDQQRTHPLNPLNF